MNKLFISLLLLVTFIVGFGQKRGDNTIIIDTTVSMTKLKTILFQNGYNVEGQDTSFITTSAKAMKHAAVVKLIIARTDSVIYLKGQRKITVEIWGMKEEFMPIDYWKNKSVLAGECWWEMDKIAKLLGSRVRYMKQ